MSDIRPEDGDQCANFDHARRQFLRRVSAAATVAAAGAIGGRTIVDELQRQVEEKRLKTIEELRLQRTEGAPGGTRSIEDLTIHITDPDHPLESQRTQALISAQTGVNGEYLTPSHTLKLDTWMDAHPDVGDIDCQVISGLIEAGINRQYHLTIQVIGNIDPETGLPISGKIQLPPVLNGHNLQDVAIVTATKRADCTDLVAPMFVASFRSDPYFSVSTVENVNDLFSPPSTSAKG